MTKSISKAVTCSLLAASTAAVGAWEDGIAKPFGVKRSTVTPLQETYAEKVQELEAIGGDPSFLEPPHSNAKWDGTIDERAYFGIDK